MKENTLTASRSKSNLQERSLGAESFVTMLVAEHWFALPISRVKDVVRSQAISPVPNSREDILGIMSLHGEIATAISLEVRLGLPVMPESGRMQVVVQQDDEWFCLPVEQIGEVLAPMATALQPVEEEGWKQFSHGKLALDGKSYTLLDLKAVIS